MTLQTRLLLLVTALVLFAIAATAVPLTLTSRSSTLDDARAEAQRLATVVSRSAAYSERAWRDVEATIGRQMVVQAAITAEWIAAAEQAGMSPKEINDRLRGVTRRTALDEIWVTDSRGHAYLHSVPGIDFTFSPDPQEQGQASAFYPLLKGKEVVIQQAQQREVDDRHFKYVGVAGVDEPRIVQVGYESVYLANLRRQVGLVRLVEETADAPGVESVRVVNERLGTSVYRAGSDPAAPALLSEREDEVLREAERTGQPQDFQQGETISVAAPIDAEGRGSVIGGVLVGLSTSRVQDQLRDDLLLAIGIAAVVLAIALLAAVIGARRIAGPVNELTTAAQAVHDTSYEPGSLDKVADRKDELGRLAQVFDQMARRMHARLARMQQEIRKLVVEVDETKREKQVAEITDTDYFRDLQRRAKELRARSGSGSGSEDGS
jgi:HAMP domain-containing protein